MLKLHPSSSKRWMNCPGSVVLVDQLPEELKQISDNEAALRGTSMHECAEKILLGSPKSAVFDEHSLDEQARKEVSYYVDYVLQFVDVMRLFGIEEKVTYEWRDVVLSGVVDFYSYNNGELRVVDFKTGKNEISPVENEQLLCYAVALVRHLDLPVDRVILSIVQGCQEKEWAVSPDKLSKHEEDLRRTIDLLADGVAPFKPGQHCRYCPAAAICDAAFEASVEQAQKEFDDTPQTISDRLFVVEEILMPYVNAVRDAAKKYLEKNDLPGWKLFPVRRRHWKDGLDMSSVLRWVRKKGAKMEKIVSGLAPSQLEKIVGSRVPDNLVEMKETSHAVRKNDASEFRGEFRED